MLRVEARVEGRVEDRVVDEGPCVFLLVRRCESGIEGGLSTRHRFPWLTSFPFKIPASDLFRGMMRKREQQKTTTTFP